VLCVWSPV